MTDCLFCRIAAGEIAAELVFKNDAVVAFRDINPQAPTHILIIPRRHIATINDIGENDRELLGEMYLVAAQLARQEGFAEDGYRVTMNCNEGAGQTVFHIHLHLLGGRRFGWPPG
ncbi:MAG TPA: histidine triad nucleotide-binding protein [Woeseiaceae bacterium]